MTRISNVIPHFVDAIAPRPEMEWRRYGERESGFIFETGDCKVFNKNHWSLLIQASGLAIDVQINPMVTQTETYELGCGYYMFYSQGKLKTYHNHEFLEKEVTREEAIKAIHKLWSDVTTGKVVQPTFFQ